MKFSQLIGYNQINIFLQNHAENEVGRLVPTACDLKTDFLWNLKLD